MNSKDKESRKPIKALRTYQGDVDELMSKKGESATTIFIAEEKRREEKPDLLVGLGKNEARNKSLLLLSGVILCVGLAIVGMVYWGSLNQGVEVAEKEKPLISFTLEKEFPVKGLSKEQLSKNISEEVRSFNQQLNSVLFLNTYDNEKLYDIEEIIKTLSPNIPGPLLRSFDDKYMFGVLSYNTNEFFMILKTNDYALSYSGMLSWEGSLARDLSLIFNIDTTALNKPFVDLSIKNKDLRILKSESGKTELVYSFIDRNTLVITKNEDIFNAILAKYLTSQNTR